MNIWIKTHRGHLTTVCICAPEGAEKIRIVNFMNAYQWHLSSVNNMDYIIVGRDCSAQIGQQEIGNLIHNNVQKILNENEKTLRNFVCLMN